MTTKTATAEQQEREVLPATQEQPASTLPATKGHIDAMTLVGQAVSNGASVENIDKLIELVKFNDAREALRAYNAAFTEAQSKFPEIPKTKKGHHDNWFAPYEEIVPRIRPVLMQHGFSFRHEITESGDAKMVTVTCILAHREGHSESSTLSGPADNSGSKNAIQAIASTVKYLKRYTLEAVTGIVTEDGDDDGNAAGAAETITESQIADLEAKIEEVGADRAKFLKYCRVREPGEILAKNFKAVCAKLDEKARHDRSARR